MATLAGAAEVKIPEGSAPDSLNQMTVLLDPEHATAVRTEALAQGTGGYALRQGDWVYLPKQGSCGMTVQYPTAVPWGQPYFKMGLTNSDVTAQGMVKLDAPVAQLYNLRDNLLQTANRFNQEPDIGQRMAARLNELVPQATGSKKK
jgi:hypothetical protein